MRLNIINLKQLIVDRPMIFAINEKVDLGIVPFNISLIIIII